MTLSARQSLVCAALTGWRGDGPCPWQSPMAKGDIIAWAASYLGGEEGLAAAFADLAREGLFHQVLYSVFAAPVYYCSYDGRFVDELPGNIAVWITGATISDLKDFWSAEL
ncbi:MAG TPA: hypothetical protein VM120_13970 [Bryobacteraceae bacterium]|nr:hypothetical protein [Bryobacteraceae bacterium]